MLSRPRALQEPRQRQARGSRKAGAGPFQKTHPQRSRDSLDHGEPMPLSAPRPSQSPVLSQPLITSPPTGQPPQPLTTTRRPRRRPGLLS